MTLRPALYSGPERSGICRCGHSWEDHHLGVVMRDHETDGGPEAYIPQECEFYGCNEMGGLDDEGKDHCHSYYDAKPDKEQS